MSMLDRIDALREKAANLALEDRDEAHRSALAAVEEEILVLLAQYKQLPHCPFTPCVGRLEKTPTNGVLLCTHCKATALRGRT